MATIFPPERIEREARLGERPAPFVLYGKIGGRGKEYCWWLDPNKPKRQGIAPKDRVRVWAQNKSAPVRVTRVEPAEATPDRPTARVLNKILGKTE